MTRPIHRLATAAALVSLAAGGALSAATVEAAPRLAQTAASRPAPARAAARPPAVSQPVAHAQRAGLRTCAAAVGQASATVIDTAHDAASVWESRAPDGHAFQSVIGLSYPNTVAPRAGAVLVTSPTRTGGCDVSTVQVQPTTRSCAVLQADLVRGGARAVGLLSGTPLIQSGPTRYMLLPAAANSCVIVAVGVTFSQ